MKLQKFHELPERDRRGLLVIAWALDAMNDNHSSEEEAMWCGHHCGLSEESLQQSVYENADAPHTVLNIGTNAYALQKAVWDLVVNRHRVVDKPEVKPKTDEVIDAEWTVGPFPIDEVDLPRCFCCKEVAVQGLDRKADIGEVLPLCGNGICVDAARVFRRGPQ